MFSEFGNIAHVTKREDIKKHIKDNMYKAIMLRYTENHKIDRYKFYNPDTKTVVMSREIK